MKTLETKRLLLRDWNENDIGCEVFDEQAIRYLMNVKNNYAVVLKENNIIIGTIGLNEDADGNTNIRNVGISILEPYRNKGYISEALYEVIKYAIEIVDELSYLCFVDDKRSEHIAKKFGFQYIKTFEKVRRKPDDEPKDFYYYRLNLRDISNEQSNN